MKIMAWFDEWTETFEYVKCEPVLLFLPMEILVKIFTFLNPADLMSISLTCSRFLDALQHRTFSNKWILNFTERYSSQFSVPIYFFTKCKRVFPSIVLHCAQAVDDYASEDFWMSYGENINELHFMSGILRKEEFINVLKYTKNIKSLKIEANNMFKNWVINKCAYERRLTFPQCSHISLARNNILSTDLFEYLMATSPNLKSIDLSNCLQLMNPPERNRFLDSVFDFLRGNANRIESLDFSNTTTDDMFLDNLGRIDLKLKELHLTFMGSTKNSNYGLPVLIRNQPNLEKFDLTASPSVNDIVVRLIANNMTNMRILLLKKCHNLTDNGVGEIAKLLRLESLEISDCDYVTDVGVMNGVLSGKPKRSLEKLSLGLLQTLTEAVVIRLSYFYEHLRYLNLNGVSNAVTDNALQSILRHMLMLRNLNMDSCCKLTDFGFTGVSSDIYARRHHSIRNLRGLQILSCNGLYKITDFTLIDAFQFLELKEAYFARCNFSVEGIMALVENCPSLEVLDLSECKNIDDDCIKAIATHLPRLKTLKLNRCEKITEKCFEVFYDNCSELRNIFIRNCKLQFDPADHLMYMSSLRKVVT